MPSLAGGLPLLAEQALREHLDLLGERTAREELMHRSLPRNRLPDARVGLEGARIHNGHAELVTAPRCERRTDIMVLSGLDLIHDQHGREGLGTLCQELRGGRYPPIRGRSRPRR